MNYEKYNNDKVLTLFFFVYWFERNVQKDQVGPIRAWELSENLLELGHRIVIFVPKRKTVRKREEVTIVDVPTVNRRFLMPLTFFVFSFIWALVVTIRNKPDVVYMRDMNNVLPLILSKLLRIPYVIEVHGLPGLQQTEAGRCSIKLALSELIYWTNFRWADKIIPIVGGLRTLIEQRYRIPLEKMTVISSGSNVSLFQPHDSQECRKTLGLDLDRSYVGFIGTLYHYQGIQVLVEAAPHILEKIPNTSFLIVGDGEMRDICHRKVMNQGLLEYFIFPGQVPYEEVKTYVNAMDVCVAPFLKFERPFSAVKIFDYFACGKPVVVSEVDSTKELLADKNIAILVPPENPKELAAELVYLLSDEHERRRLGETGRKFVLENYSWKSLAVKTLEVIRQVRPPV